MSRLMKRKLMMYSAVFICLGGMIAGGFFAAESLSTFFAHKEPKAAPTQKISDGEWEVGLVLAPDKEGNPMLKLVARDEYKQAILGAHVTARLTRPNGGGQSFEIEFAEKTRGRYETGVRFPLPGPWDLSWKIEAQGRVVEGKEHLRAPAGSRR